MVRVFISSRAGQPFEPPRPVVAAPVVGVIEGVAADDDRADADPLGGVVSAERECFGHQVLRLLWWATPPARRTDVSTVQSWSGTSRPMPSSTTMHTNASAAKISQGIGLLATRG